MRSLIVFALINDYNFALINDYNIALVEACIVATVHAFMKLANKSLVAVEKEVNAATDEGLLFLQTIEKKLEIEYNCSKGISVQPSLSSTYLCYESTMGHVHKTLRVYNMAALKCDCLGEQHGYPCQHAMAAAREHAKEQHKCAEHVECEKRCHFEFSTEDLLKFQVQTTRPEFTPQHINKALQSENFTLRLKDPGEIIPVTRDSPLFMVWPQIAPSTKGRKSSKPRGTRWKSSIEKLGANYSTQNRRAVVG